MSTGHNMVLGSFPTSRSGKPGNVTEGIPDEYTRDKSIPDKNWIFSDNEVESIIKEILPIFRIWPFPEYLQKTRFLHCPLSKPNQESNKKSV